MCIALPFIRKSILSGTRGMWCSCRLAVSRPEYCISRVQFSNCTIHLQKGRNASFSFISSVIHHITVWWCLSIIRVGTTYTNDMQFSEYPQNGPCPHLSHSTKSRSIDKYIKCMEKEQIGTADQSGSNKGPSICRNISATLRLHFAPISLLKRTREEVHLSPLIPPPWKWKKSFS